MLVTTETGLDQRALAVSLIPALREACHDRLGDVTWFKADWQRGGAATGISQYHITDDQIVPVIVKLPIVGRELRWTRRLQPDIDVEQPTPPDLVVPRLYASGETLGGYDLSWIIIERFEHGPLGMHWEAGHLERIIDATTRFHMGTRSYDFDREPRYEDWEEHIIHARESVTTNQLDHRKRWIKSLKELSKRVDDIVGMWRSRPILQWVHGDLHLANAMSRHSMNEGPVSLIDMAEVHPGHWIEDAVYFERQFWAVPERLNRQRPIRMMYDRRKELGLPVGDAHAVLAAIRRVLLAASAPAFMKSEGHPAYLEACLNRLENSLREIP